jgi:hypothetical protein
VFHAVLNQDFEPERLSLSNDKVFAMAEALDVSEHWLMGYDKMPLQILSEVVHEKIAASVCG